MTRPGKIAFVGFLLIGVAGGLAEHRTLVRQREQLAAGRTEIARLEADVRQAQARLEAIRREESAAAAALAAGKADIAIGESSPKRLWSNRVMLLKQLLTELPDQQIPELKLLSPEDWIDVTRRGELDTSAKIRAALAAARATARSRFAPVLQDALRRFTGKSDGELPADIGQLAPFLSAPADGEMLARYEMTRAGKIENEGEFLIREKPVSDMILTLSLNGWNITNGPKVPAGPDETDTDVLNRGANAIGAALATTFGDEGKEMMANVAQGVQTMVAYAENLPKALGDRFGDDVKAAARQFTAEHPGEPLANFGQLLPYLQNADQVVAKARPAFAHWDYLLDHQFRPPADPAELQPYLEKPFDAEKTMSRIKTTYDGEQISVSFSLTLDPK